MEPVFFEPQGSYLWLLVEKPNGFRVELQTGGSACRHPILEGYLLLLCESNWISEGLSIWDEDEYPAETFLNRLGLEYDPSRLAASEEAMVGVKLTKDSSLPEFLRLEVLWLLYQNSD